MPKRIPLTQGKFAIVDDNMFDYLNQWKWCATKTSKFGNMYYAYGHTKIDGKYKRIIMHRLILNAKLGEITDHRSRNGLDNRCCNIRLCTYAENNQNRKGVVNSSSKYKGVSRYNKHKKWQVHIRLKDKRMNLGYFDNEVEAAKIYDREAKKLFGEFAYTNF